MGQHILNIMTVIGSLILLTTGGVLVLAGVAWLIDWHLRRTGQDLAPDLTDSWEELLDEATHKANSRAMAIGELTGCVEAMCRTMRFGAREATRLEQPYLATMLTNEATSAEALVAAHKEAWATTLKSAAQ